MPKIQEVIASELELESLDLWKRTGGSSNNGTWAFKSSIGEIFAKSSDDIHVSHNSIEKSENKTKI